MRLDALSRKFLDVMKREVDLNADADWEKLEARRKMMSNVSRKFRLDRDDVGDILAEMQRKGYIKPGKKDGRGLLRL
jgi:hypothetical protein